MGIRVKREGNWQQFSQKGTKGISLDLTKFETKIERLIEDNMSNQALFELLINTALENIDETEPNWTFLASRLYIKQLYQEASMNRNYTLDSTNGYGDFYELIDTLTEKGIYT